MDSKSLLEIHSNAPGWAACWIDGYYYRFNHAASVGAVRVYPPNVWHGWYGGKSPPLPVDMPCAVVLREEAEGLREPMVRGLLPAMGWYWGHNGEDGDIVMFGHGSNLPEPPLADDHPGRIYTISMRGAGVTAIRDVIEEAPQPAPRSEEEAYRLMLCRAVSDKFDGSKPPSSQVMPSDVKGVYAAAVRAQQEESTVAAHAVKPDPRDHRGLLVVAPIDHRPGRWRS